MRGEDVFILDVREPYEYQIAQIGGKLIPQNDVPQRLAEIPRDREIVVQCRSGARSQKIAEFLKQSGYHPGSEPGRRNPCLERRNRPEGAEVLSGHRAAECEAHDQSKHLVSQQVRAPASMLIITFGSTCQWRSGFLAPQ